MPVGQFELRYTGAARADLLRLFDFLLHAAQSIDDLDAAQIAVNTITGAVEGLLSRTPFIFRKSGNSPFYA